MDAASTSRPASSEATCPMRYENQKLEGLTFDLDNAPRQPPKRASPPGLLTDAGLAAQLAGFG
jgi:hypothetical protein